MIREYEKRIRDRINEPRRIYTLIKNKGIWLQLVCSLDVIGDTQFAIDAYSDMILDTTQIEKRGRLYLAVYGLFQAFFLQQDAVMHTCEALKVPYDPKSYPDLQRIRDIRNSSTGHPTRRDRNKKTQATSYHMIYRLSLEKGSFSLASYTETDSKFEQIDISKLLKDQKEGIEAILSSILMTLEEEDRKHKEEFRMEKLQDKLTHVHYGIEKIFEGISRTDTLSSAMGTIGIKSVQSCLDTLREALAERCIELDTYEAIDMTYDLLSFPIDKLHTYFEQIEAGQQPTMDMRTAYVFAYFIRGQVNDLLGVIQAIDEDYAT